MCVGLFTHHTVAVGIPHVLVGRVSPVDRRYTVGPASAQVICQLRSSSYRARASTSLVGVGVAESSEVGMGVAVAVKAAPGSRMISSVDSHPVRTWSIASTSTWMHTPPSKFRVNRFRNVNNQEHKARESGFMLLSSDYVTLIEKRKCHLG